MKDNRIRNLAIVIVTLLVIMLPLVLVEFYLYVVRIIFIYAMVVIGMNMFMGYCGQINLGVAGFFCLGAYIPAILGAKLGWPYLAAFPVGVVTALLVAWLVSWPLLRLRSHSMAIGTLAFGMAVYLVFERFKDITGGTDGMVVPPLVLFGHEMGYLFYYYFILAFLLAAFVVEHRLANSRVGRAFKAVRDDEDAAEAMGVYVEHYRRLGWLLNAGFAAVGGALYVQQAGFISPDTFSIAASLQILVMFCVGGPGTILGPVVGAGIMICLPYFLIAIQHYMYLVQGLILFGILRFLPSGVVGTIQNIWTSIHRHEANVPLGYTLEASALRSGYERNKE